MAIIQHIITASKYPSFRKTQLNCENHKTSDDPCEAVQPSCVDWLLAEERHSAAQVQNKHNSL